MKWCIYQTANCNIIEDFFQFNKIDHQMVDLWDADSLEFGCHNIPADLLLSSNNVLIMSIDVLKDLLNWAVSRQNVIKFLHNNNHLWVWSDADGFSGANPYKERLIEFDLLVPKNRLRIFIDAEPSKEHYINQLQNILIIKIRYNIFMQLTRIHNAYAHKESDAKDFLLLTAKRRLRPHRQILLRELNSRNDLITKGNVFYNTTKNKIVFNNDSDDMFSADLYRKSWLEIVPETFYKNGYYFTEKTGKPISAKTPFLAVSTKGYLEYLKSFGFQTFSSLISEKYDQQHKIQDRVTLIVDQLEDIIRNGSESFYHASQSILDHNYNVLSEITGKWQHQMDAIIQQSIDQTKSD